MVPWSPEPLGVRKSTDSVQGELLPGEEQPVLPQRLLALTQELQRLHAHEVHPYHRRALRARGEQPSLLHHPRGHPLLHHSQAADQRRRAHVPTVSCHSSDPLTLTDKLFPLVLLNTIYTPYLTLCTPLFPTCLFTNITHNRSDCLVPLFPYFFYFILFFTITPVTTLAV